MRFAMSFSRSVPGVTGSALAFPGSTRPPQACTKRRSANLVPPAKQVMPLAKDLRAAGLVLFFQISALVPCPAFAADLATNPILERKAGQWAHAAGAAQTISGRVSVLDGHTLWFPDYGVAVRLAGIDSCDVAQWAFDASKHGDTSILKPVPCGAMAGAWLRRVVGSGQVDCRVSFSAGSGVFVGACRAGGRDLAIEMLRVGWARATMPSPFPSRYLAWQRYAMSARYGIWGTYVLDMDEWRRKSVDTTLSRAPIADFNLLAERESEISPVFEDNRKRPQRMDR